MTRCYRFLVTVYIEGDAPTLPPIEEIAEYVATQVQDADDHDLDTCVRAIETEDYRTAAPFHGRTRRASV